MDRCGCEYGGDCTSISVCAAESMVEDAVEELQRKHEALEAALQSIVDTAPGNGEDCSYLKAKAALGCSDE